MKYFYQLVYIYGIIFCFNPYKNFMHEFLICYFIDSGFGGVLDDLHETNPSFYLNNFTSKDTVSLKAQHILARVLFGKIVQDVEVEFNMTTRQKVVFGCLQVAHAQDFLLVIPIDG
jgi:hypothetical protein